MTGISPRLKSMVAGAAMAAALLFVLLSTPGTGRAQGAPLNQYLARWGEMNLALLAFVRAPATAGKPLPWSRYEPHRRRFAAALVWLVKAAPPRSQIKRHFRLLPRYEELLAAMRVIMLGLKSKDEVIERWGWGLFRSSLLRLKDTLRAIDPSGG